MAKRKVVMEEHEGSVLVGVMQDGCDPIIKTLEGDLEAALQTIPQQLTEAQEKWAGSPRMPKHEPPKAAKAKAEPEKTSEALPLLAGEKAEEIEATVEEKAGEAEAEVAEPQAALTAVEPEPEVPPAELSKEEKERLEVASDSELPPPPVAQAAPAVTGEWEYYLKDGRGPFPDVQSAMEEMGLDKEKRPQHNRWDRLSSQLKNQIQRRPKA